MNNPQTAFPLDSTPSNAAGKVEGVEMGKSAWKVIETAPKDATRIWCFNGSQGVMHWIEGDGYALWVWTEELLSDADPEPEQPTHWMPLPEPPAA